ncbi:MAG: hypothetical protein QOF99_7002 [Pseudonocardiales bacterium]|jgi:hypothetical protein|nr:hypothetical protein [Pseudonocardiales bacterium]
MEVFYPHGETDKLDAVRPDRAGQPGSARPGAETSQ